MQRFFFDLQIGPKVIEDNEGRTFCSLDDARANAIHAAREIMSERVARGQKPYDGGGFRIANAAGRTMMLVTFHDAMERAEPTVALGYVVSGLRQSKLVCAPVKSAAAALKRVESLEADSLTIFCILNDSYRKVSFSDLVAAAAVPHQGEQEVDQAF